MDTKQHVVAQQNLSFIYFPVHASTAFRVPAPHTQTACPLQTAPTLKDYATFNNSTVQLND